MKRSQLLGQSAALGMLALGMPGNAVAAASTMKAPIAPLAPPAGGVPVAFLLSSGAVMIDFAGPWEVFQDAHVSGAKAPPFTLFTVAETTQPIAMSGGAMLVPHYTFANVPTPKVVVVPAQADATLAVKAWLNAVARQADLMMSVCTGAFVLAQAGLLDGRDVTTHHSAFGTLAMQFPTVRVKRGVRFVDDGSIATSAGLSAGIDLALHVVARYYGEEAARQTAYDMEYVSDNWLDGNNLAYLKPQLAHAGDAICPVCWMEVDPKTATKFTYNGTTYYFCMPEHEYVFAADPQRFLSA